jgi:hypothetical protein
MKNADGYIDGRRATYSYSLRVHFTQVVIEPEYFLINSVSTTKKIQSVSVNKDQPDRNTGI